jgi:3D (Asp-Asp-Asp) domain-containing protein
MAKLKMSILLGLLLSLTLVGCLLQPKEVNNYEVHLAVSKLPKAKEPFVLPEIEIEGDIATEDADLKYLGEFLITGYCDCPICQEEWVGTTALGVPPTEEWTIAVDPDIIPLGSYVWIDGHRYRAEDVGGAIQENHIDMFMGSHETCYQDVCNGYKEVYIEEGEK